MRDFSHTIWNRSLIWAVVLYTKSRFLVNGNWVELVLLYLVLCWKLDYQIPIFGWKSDGFTANILAIFMSYFSMWYDKKSQNLFTVPQIENFIIFLPRKFFTWNQFQHFKMLEYQKWPFITLVKVAVQSHSYTAWNFCQKIVIVNSWNFHTVCIRLFLLTCQMMLIQWCELLKVEIWTNTPKL